MKLSLTFNTLRHLKAKQIFYQVFYRLIRTKPVTACKNSLNSIEYQYLSFSDFLPVIECADKTGRFFFLNQDVVFKQKVDWQYSSNGKLWNYNLQYANYLLQENIPIGKRLNWLADLHVNVADGKVPLEPYPVSLRSINTIRLICRKRIDDKNIIATLYAELNFLNTRFEYHLLGNHLLENAFALLMGGGFFNNEKWLSKGYTVLEKELNEQILADGAHFELSPMYHQVILYRLLELIDWYSNYNNKREGFLDFITFKAAMMLTWLKNITFTNNEIPAFNDCAPGVAFDTEQLFQYSKCLKINAFVDLPLSDSGYRMYHKGNYQCAVDVAPIGAAYQAGHGHADVLSFILYYKNRPVLVEAGTSTYNEGQVREFERSTAAHNTVVVNETNSSQVWGGFRVANRAGVHILKENDREIVAVHDGYIKDFKVTHQRSFKFDTEKIEVQDELKGGVVSRAVAYFHLHPSIEYSINNHRVILNEIGSLIFSGAINVEAGNYGWSNGYNNVSQSAFIAVHFNRLLQTQIEFL